MWMYLHLCQCGSCDRKSDSVSYVCVCVCRAPRFKGYQQQDSQELLHYLLDSVRVEETKVSVCLQHLFS